MPALVSLRSSDMAIAPLVRTEAALARTARPEPCPGVVYTRRGVGRRACLALLAAVLGLVASGCVKPSVTQQAMSLARRHRETEAVTLLRAELAKTPGDVEARAMLVRVMAFTGDMHGAEAEAAELAKHVPEGDPRAWIELGHAREVAHDFDGALAAYDTAASAAPASPAGPLEGGMRAARWGEVEEAAPRLEEAIKRGAKDAETWHTLGLVRVHLGDLPGARAAYREGLVADPKSAECWLGLATIAAMKEDGAAALQAYDAILVLRPRFAPAELGRAWALAKLGRKDDARAALDRAEEMGASAGSVAKQRAALAAP
jgi:cytochrome c-type biogenesis protein CcmH/NrfG